MGWDEGWTLSVPKELGVNLGLALYTENALILILLPMYFLGGIDHLKPLEA